MKQAITLDSILPINTEVFFNWRYSYKINDTWGWNSGYGKKGMSVREVIEQRIKTGMGGDIKEMEFENIRFVSYNEYRNIVSATAND